MLESEFGREVREDSTPGLPLSRVTLYLMLSECASAGALKSGSGLTTMCRRFVDLDLGSWCGKRLSKSKVTEVPFTHVEKRFGQQKILLAVLIQMVPMVSGYFQDGPSGEL